MLTNRATSKLLAGIKARHANDRGQ